MGERGRYHGQMEDTYMLDVQSLNSKPCLNSNAGPWPTERLCGIPSIDGDFSYFTVTTWMIFEFRKAHSRNSIGNASRHNEKKGG